MQRDFTYVDDVVEGIVRVLARPAEPDPGWSGDRPDPGTSRAPYRLYNVGNDRPVELTRYIEVLEACLGRKARKTLLPLPARRRARTRADIARPGARLRLPAPDDPGGRRGALRGLVPGLLPGSMSRPPARPGHTGWSSSTSTARSARACSASLRACGGPWRRRRPVASASAWRRDGCGGPPSPGCAPSAPILPRSSTTGARCWTSRPGARCTSDAFRGPRRRGPSPWRGAIPEVQPHLYLDDRVYVGASAPADGRLRGDDGLCVRGRAVPRRRCWRAIRTSS